jgi:hypothetical protein
VKQDSDVEVCPRCCATLIVRGMAKAGKVCQGCEFLQWSEGDTSSVFGPEQDRPHHRPKLSSIGPGTGR